MNRMKWIFVTALVLGGIIVDGRQPSSAAENDPLPAYLSDRGEGMHTSLFGTYVQAGEFLFYPFYEYTKTSRSEYKPGELGFSGEEDFFGKLVEQEYLVFFAYGFSDRLMAEFESSLHTRAIFRKASDDPSAVPNHLRESGLGDTEGQLRWRGLKETENRPEILAFFEAVFPLQKSKKLIGTQHWELEPGLVITKGFPWGTGSARLSVSYTTEDHKSEFGEYALEYVKRASDAWRFVLAVEGTKDEIQAIGEAQYSLTKNAVLKLDSGFGLTKKAPDVAPEIGILFSF